ncbi:hypothetical protein HY004_01880 [Candidatus Saccharibacteria bacterium]|nr:hypothetical protein [Candidatus Saccharibacteria bacterium]
MEKMSPDVLNTKIHSFIKKKTRKYPELYAIEKWVWRRIGRVSHWAM